MSDFRPFRALRYARALGPRLAPPWDVISPEERERLGSEIENIVHLTLPPGPSGRRDYALAGRTLSDWIARGALVRDAEERFYMLTERTRDGRRRRGLIGLLRVTDYEERAVLPHESTMKQARQDRLLLTRAVRANLEPLFFLYEDRQARLDAAMDAIAATGPVASGTGPDGTALELFSTSAIEGVEEIRDFLADLPVVIADGHHRYETMREYRDECRAAGGAGGADAAPEFVMGYLVNAFDPGSAIGAIHRLLRGRVAEPEAVLDRAGFACEVVADEEAGALLSSLALRRAEEHAYLVALPGGGLIRATRPRGEGLDVEVLHAEILPALGGDLSFDARPDRLLQTLREGDAALGILLNPLDAENLFRVVRDGRVLPQKSTFFTPKVASGLLVRDLPDPGRR